MKRLLEKADRCKCLALEDCGKVFLAQSTKKVEAGNGVVSKDSRF
jgi:hypothetical protein